MIKPILLCISVILNAYLLYRVALLPYLAKAFYNRKLLKSSGFFLWKPDNSRRFEYCRFIVWKARNKLLMFMEYNLWRIVTRKDSRMEAILDNVCRVAVNKGLVFKRPGIRILKRGLGLLSSAEIPARAMAMRSPYLIIVDEKWANFHIKRDIMEIIIAHEVGHIVDYQTFRRGNHLFFARTKNLSSEEFADAFAAYLYSKEKVIEFRVPWYSYHFNKEKFLAMDLDIPVNSDIKSVESHDVLTVRLNG